MRKNQTGKKKVFIVCLHKLFNNMQILSMAIAGKALKTICMFIPQHESKEGKSKNEEKKSNLSHGFEDLKGFAKSIFLFP